MARKLNIRMICRVMAYKKRKLAVKEIARLIKKHPVQVRRYLKQGEHLSTP